jgi:hypothetical protein
MLIEKKILNQKDMHGNITFNYTCLNLKKKKTISYIQINNDTLFYFDYFITNASSCDDFTTMSSPFIVFIYEESHSFLQTNQRTP